jgi:hypothetical protein
VDPQVRITASELPWGMRPRIVAVVVCEFVPETGHRDVRDALALPTTYPRTFAESSPEKRHLNHEAVRLGPRRDQDQVQPASRPITMAP